MEQITKDIALLLGGWTVIVTGVISFISYLATQKIIGSWDTRNQRELEILRNNQAETQVLLKDTTSAITSSQSLLQARRVEAVDKLWKAILALKDHYSPVTFFFTIALPSEYKTALANSAIFSGLRKIDDHYIVNFPQEVSELESFRPYLGETLWLHFFVYRAVLGRLALLVKWLKEGKETGDWRQDSGVQQHLKAVFEEDEFKTLMNSSPMEINYALNILDSKVLREISYILSGRRSSLESFENSRELRKLLAKEKM
jgi:hypothetical protein